MVMSRSPKSDQLAVIDLPEPTKVLADVRGYLPRGALLIKPIAARSGDVVCRFGTIVTVNGDRRARARMLDAWRQPLPHWHGCIRLTTSQVFVLAPAESSFDSRYIGPIDLARIVGTAVPVWTAPATFRQERASSPED